MKNYLNVSHVAIGWDNIQETYKCCGLDSSDDWLAEIDGTVRAK